MSALGVQRFTSTNSNPRADTEGQAADEAKEAGRAGWNR